ncbi:SDR family oxidoreductase [Lapidilactobacillus bayanensis]|uniref:SDR family oxidoreductase n=1 Tax=Lapidilactobacillus bayanensis TaxID=2485998 RepID=UPI000F79337B|nr:SDR family oxidoreductase [Lapidilactobacillus bayanensis]
MTEAKVALITGSSRGIGKQIARTLAHAGYALALNYHNNREEALDLAQELSTVTHANIQLYQGDVSVETDVNTMITKIQNDFGHLDILIANAGPFIHENIKLKDYSTAQWHEMIATNLDSFFYLIKATLPAMEQQKWGRIIALGYDQIERLSGWSMRGAYAAAKTGVATAIRTLATEESNTNITANMVCPGDIKALAKEATIDSARQQLTTFAINDKRKATGEDVARVIAFLCADDSDYLTGNIINLSGGENIIARKHDGI